MIIEQLRLNNPGRNYNYLVVCEETREALLIDPFDAVKCLETAQKNQWTITQILNTHEHLDHTSGNALVVNHTNAAVLAYYQAPIPNITRGLRAYDLVKVGTSISFQVLYTPGHTANHICLFSEEIPQDTPVLFTGDTLFNVGCGNCINGGNPEMLFETFETQLSTLPEETRIYPGHDYAENNLAFALSLEPHNPHLPEMMKRLQYHQHDTAYTTQLPYVTCLHEEKLVNPFFRLESAELEQAVRKQLPLLPERMTRKDLFIAVRQLKNSF